MENMPTLLNYAFALMCAAAAICTLGVFATGNMARQPEVAGTIQTVFILGAAFIEALTLLAFVLGLIGG